MKPCIPSVVAVSGIRCEPFCKQKNPSLGERISLVSTSENASTVKFQNFPRKLDKPPVGGAFPLI